MTYCSDLDGNNSFYIGANLGEDLIACSPNAYRNSDGIIVLNYVAISMVSEEKRYLHYQRKGKTLDTLGVAEVIAEPQGIPTYCQSENPSFSYTVLINAERSRLIQYDKKNGLHRTWHFENMSLLKRAVILDESSVVLTYHSPSNEPKSAIFDTDSLSLRDIKVNGKDVYKSHLNGDTVYYAMRLRGNGHSTYGMTIHRDICLLDASSLTVKRSQWT